MRICYLSKREKFEVGALLGPNSFPKLIFFAALIFMPLVEVFPQVVNLGRSGFIADGFGSVPYLPNPTANVFISGNYAYVVSGDGLEIVDITLPGFPVHRGSLMNGSGGALLLNPNSVFVSGNYAYVTSYRSNALEIIDISNPAAPVHKGSIINGAGGAFLQDVSFVFVSGNYAYITNGNGGDALEIIDVSNPALPVHKGSIFDGGGAAPFLSQANSVFVSGNYAYVASTGSNALEIIDVSNPASPVHKGNLSDGGGVAPFLNNPVSVSVAGNYAFVASSNSNALEIVNVSNPAAPAHKGSIGSIVNVFTGPLSVAVSGNYAHVANQYGLAIFDVTNPAAPSLKGSAVDLTGATIMGSNAISLSGNNAYVTCAKGLGIIDVSNLAAPTVKSVLSNGTGGAAFNTPNSLYVAGSYAYIVGNTGTFEIVDVSNPNAPVHKASLRDATGGAKLATPQSVFVSGNFAYVASSNNNGTLEIIDVTNQSLPVHKGSISDGGGLAPFLNNPVSVYVAGNYAYVASAGSNALEIIDVTNPAAPAHKGSLLNGGSALLNAPNSVYVSGNYAYVTSGNNNGTLEIVDVTSPSSPLHKGSISDGGGPAPFLKNANTIFVSENYAYVGGFFAFEIVDVTNPAAPTHKGGLSTQGDYSSIGAGVYAQGNFAYISNSFGVEAIDISNLSSPSVYSSLTTSGGIGIGVDLASPNGLFLTGNYLFIINQYTSSLQILFVYSPSISSFTPSGAPQSSITISGQNFDTFVSAAINGIPATITGVTSTAITATVPNGATTGQVSLTYNGVAIKSNSNFIVIPTAPTATNLQQTSFNASWSDVGLGAYPNGKYFLDVSTDNFTTFVGSFNNLAVGKVLTYAVTGLTPGTTYYWRVRSTDGTTVSGNSNAIITLTIPATPTANAATAFGQTGFTANWSLVANATNYFLDVASDAGFTSMVPGYNNLSLGSTTTSQIVSGLNSGTYYYRVRSSNAGGASPSSGTTTALTVPSNPSTIAATAITATGFTANWNSSGAGVSYFLDVSTDNFATFVSGYNNTNVGAVSTLAVTGLSSGTSYQYRVRANNTSGTSGNSNTSAALTLPAAPLATAATSILPAQFNASWNKVIGATGYLLDIAANAGFSPAISLNIPTGDVSTYLVSALIPATAYYYRLRASNATGNSAYSNVISVTTLAAAVTTPTSALSFTNIASASMTLNFNGGSGASHLVVASVGSPVTGQPANATGYNPNLAFGSGDALGNGFVISTGASPINITNLSAQSTYYFQIFDFNGSGVTANYNNTAVPAASQITLAPTPTAQPSGIAFSNVSTTSIAVSFNAAAGSPTGYLVLRASGSAPSTNPSNGVTYSTGASLGNATVADVGSPLSFFDAGLTSNTAYYYKVFAFNGNGVTTNFLFTAPLQDNMLTVPSNPVTSAVALSNINATGFLAGWTRDAGASSYLDVSSDNFVTYATGYNNLNVSTAVSYSVTGLASGINYQFRVRAFNASWTSGNSNSTTVLTLPAAPATSPATAVTPTSFNANWNKVTGATAYFLDVANDAAFTSFIMQNTPAGNSSSFLVSSLTPASTYYYRVSASNSSGTSAESVPTSIQTLSPPVSPQSFGVVFSNVSSNSLTVGFSPGSGGASHLVVASAGSPLITALPINQISYSANANYGSGDPIGNGFVVSNGSSTSVTVNNLVLATTYYFQVFDYSGSGGTQNYLTSTVPGNPASQSTLATTSISQPTNMTFANVITTGLSASFTAASGSPAGYLVLRSINSSLSTPPSNGTTYTADASLGTATVAYSGSATNFNETTLTAGTTYYYSVFSYNGSGGAINYLLTNPLQGSVVMVPPAPVADAATAIGSSFFTANWSATLGVTNYLLDVSTDNFNSLVAGYSNLAVGAGLSYNVAGLNSGVTYQYRVRAQDASGTSTNSNPVSVLTLPSAPTGLADANVTQGGFAASWTKSNGATAYFLDVAADSLFSSVIFSNVSLGNSASYTVSGLSAATTYFFRLRASNATGLSANSVFVTLTTLASSASTQSSALSFSAVSTSAITLNFTPGSGTSHLLVISRGSLLNAVPLNRTTYTASTTYSSGSQIGNGYVVNLGLPPITVTGLSAGTTYYFQVFDFDGTSGTENYNTMAAATNPASQITLSNVPLTQPTNLVFSNQTGTSVNVSFTAALDNPNGYIVLRAPGTQPTGQPQNGVSYATGTTIGNANVVDVGPALSFFDGGLPTSTVYYYNIYSFSGSGSSINYNPATPLQGSVTLDVEPPTIGVLSNPTTISGGNTPIFNVTITDNVSVADAMIYYRGISHKSFRSAPVSPSGGANNYSVQIQTTWYDSLGIEYYFWAVDENGNQTAKPTVNSLVQLVSPSISLPSLPSGSRPGDYRIVAFPYLLTTDNKVTTVYSGVPWNDDSKAAMWWWDPVSKNGQGGYDQYGSANTFQTVDPGKGYWVITSTSITPQLTNVPAPKYNNSNLFTMTLKPNWNQIGNPYPLPISWDDVIAFNQKSNPSASFSALSIFDNTGYKTATGGVLLNPFEGGFVKNLSSSDINIQIPFLGQAPSGGRMDVIGSDLSKDVWKVFLNINQGNLTNQLGGFGMHPLAKTGPDLYDNYNPPRFMGSPEVDFTEKDFLNMSFSCDMVATQENWQWQFTAQGKYGELAQLSWSQNLNIDPRKQLFLLDEERLNVVDMTGASEYKFTLSEHSRFSIFYGSDIESKVACPAIAASPIYPNPLGIESQGTVTISLPDSENSYSIGLQIYNGQGELIDVETSNMEPGIHHLKINLANKTLAPGIYLYKISVGGIQSSAVFTGKIVKP